MKPKLTAKANAILSVLLHSDHPLTASQIVSVDEKLNSNTVQSVLRTLLKEGYIEVADIVYSGNVLCRSYRATEAAREVSVDQFVSHFHDISKSVSVPVIFSALIESKEDDKAIIDELEEMIRQKKEALNNAKVNENAEEGEE